MAVSEAFNPFPVANDAYNTGRQRAQQQGLQNAFAMVGSDPVAAQNEFLRYGAPEQATAVGKIVQAKRQQDVRTQATTMAQGGDSAGAARSLAINGDGEAASALMKVGDDVLKQEQDKSDKQAAIAHYLQQLPQEQRAATFAQYAPELVKQGLISQDGATNPKLDDQSLQFVQAKALGYKTTLEMEEKRRADKLAQQKQDWEENKPVSVAPDTSLVDPRTHQSVYTAPGKPETKVVKDAMGNEHIVQITDPGEGGRPQAQGDPSAPRGIRNNNPLNVTALSGGQAWNGQTGVDGHYAVFATPEAGIAAADQNLQSYAQKHGINTLAGVIQRWAPPTENDTGSYIATVSKDLGVDPNQPLDLSNPQVRRSVLTSMSKVETGRSNAMGQPQAQQGGQPQAQGQPNVREVYSTAPPPSDPATAGLTGEDFLKTMSPARAKTIQAYANGDLALPTGRSAGSPQVQKLVEDVMQYDPSASATNLQSRQSTRKAFTTGPYSQTISATNTVIGHLGSLNDAVDRLNNTDLPWYNKAAQSTLAATGNKDVQGALADFNTYKTMVANELTKVYRGSSGAEADIQGWLKQLDTAQSPTALKHTIKAMVEGLGSRIDALGTTYSQGMGRTEDPFSLLNPRAVSTLQKLKESVGIEAPPPPGRTAPIQAQGGQASGQRLTPEQARKLPPGTRFVGTDGVERTVH